VANRGKHNTVACGRIPDEFIGLAHEGALAFGRLKYNQMNFNCVHAAALGLTPCLRVVETAIFAVWSLTRFAAAEVT
jgi:hypothetical protein